MGFTSTRPPRLFSLKDVAALLGVSTKAVRRKITAGELTSHRIGGTARLRKWISDLAACRAGAAS